MAYALPGSREVDEDRFEVCCMTGWYADERRIAFQQVSAQTLDEARLPRSAWRGWKPFALPTPEKRPGERPSIQVEGRTHHLFWMDLHAHSTMSAWVEGSLSSMARHDSHSHQPAPSF